MNIKLVIGLVAIVAVAGIFLPTGNSVVERIVGATPGADFFYEILNFNGVNTMYKEVGMQKATTTLCAIKSPSATSTLDLATWQISVGTTTAATIDIGTSTNAYATSTTLVASTAVASGAQGYAKWSTVGGGVNDNIMAPNSWVLVRVNEVGLNGYKYTGACEASFTQLP